MNSTREAIGKSAPRFRLVRIVQLGTRQRQIARGGEEARVEPEVEAAVFIVSRHRFLAIKYSLYSINKRRKKKGTSDE